MKTTDELVKDFLKLNTTQKANVIKKLEETGAANDEAIVALSWLTILSEGSFKDEVFNDIVASIK